MVSRVESARVHTESQEAQSTLFPLTPFSCKPASSRELCSLINLNWLAAVKLYEGGWLSFDPAIEGDLNPAQEAELNFLGRLVVAGCDESLLRQLLAGLERPYAYRLDRLFFDWEDLSWNLRPDNPERETQFEVWLDELVESGQIRMLEHLHTSVARAVSDLRRLRNW
jgi:hypothetical protein